MTEKFGWFKKSAYLCIAIKKNGPVAQLNRASDYGSEGYRFESCRGHFKRDAKQLTLYSWYDYEDATYQYHKRSTEELQVKVLEQYKKITEKQRGVRGVVPPGMYAEYGYLLYKTGKKDEGLSFLKKEVELYPESDTYISRIIKQLEK